MNCLLAQKEISWLTYLRRTYQVVDDEEEIVDQEVAALQRNDDDERHDWQEASETM